MEGPVSLKQRALEIPFPLRRPKAACSTDAPHSLRAVGAWRCYDWDYIGERRGNISKSPGMVQEAMNSTGVLAVCTWPIYFGPIQAAIAGLQDRDHLNDGMQGHQRDPGLCRVPSEVLAFVLWYDLCVACTLSGQPSQTGCPCWYQTSPSGHLTSGGRISHHPNGRACLPARIESGRTHRRRCCQSPYCGLFLVACLARRIHLLALALCTRLNGFALA